MTPAERIRSGLDALARTAAETASQISAVEQIFARQVEALCRPGDLLILHSTSGASANLCAAAQAARRLGVPVAAFLGKGGGALRALADLAVVVPSDDISRIQEIHLALGHLIVEVVEEELAR